MGKVQFSQPEAGGDRRPSSKESDMTAESIRVVASVRARRGCEEETKKILIGLLEPTRREPGCTSYHLCQDSADPGCFVFVEEWASEAALDRHMTLTHVEEALRRVGPLLADTPEIRRLRRID